MGVTVTTTCDAGGHTVVTMENELLQAVILPEFGAKIWQITYKPRRMPLLWHHPRLVPAKVPPRACYDDHFFGGWDELYPNDMPETLNGKEVPDHGELWGVPWSYAIERLSEREATIRLWVDTVVCASRMEKRITLRDGEAKLRFRHRLANTGEADIPFLWKLHVALAVGEACRIDLGARNMFMDIYGNPRNGRTQVEYEWPFLAGPGGAIYDMRPTLLKSARVKELQYATEMAAGWCAFTHTKERVGFGLAFDLDALPSCWVFGSYGGWRDLETVILEPCTGYPMYVNDGVELGTHRVLKAGESLACEVTAVVYEGLEAVGHIDGDGNVTGKSGAGRSEPDARDGTRAR